MFGRRRKAKTGSAIGCGFMFTTGLLVCALLVINAMIVRSFLSVNLSNVDERITQAAQFVLPVLMIFFEFWFFDLITQRRFNDDVDEE